MNGNTNDHDLLITLVEKFNGLKEDTTDIKATLKCMNTTCMKRPEDCEKKFVQQSEVKAAKGTMVVLGGVGAALMTALIWFAKAVFGVGG